MSRVMSQELRTENYLTVRRCQISGETAGNASTPSRMTHPHQLRLSGERVRGCRHGSHSMDSGTKKHHRKCSAVAAALKPKYGPPIALPEQLPRSTPTTETD